LQLQRLSCSRKLKDLFPAIERFIAEKCEAAQILLLEMCPPLFLPGCCGVKGNIASWTTFSCSSHLQRQMPPETLFEGSNSEAELAAGAGSREWFMAVCVAETPYGHCLKMSWDEKFLYVLFPAVPVISALLPLGLAQTSSLGTHVSGGRLTAARHSGLLLFD